MEKSKLTTDIFDGQEHYRFADADLSGYNTAFPDSLISFMYMNVTSANSAMDSFEQMVGRLFQGRRRDDEDADSKDSVRGGKIKHIRYMEEEK